MPRTLILSSLISFADTLTRESLVRKFPTTLAGTAALHLEKKPTLQGAVFHAVDLADPYALPRRMCGCWEKITHVFYVAAPLLSNRLVNYFPEDVQHMFEGNVLGPIAAITAFHRLRLQAQPLGDTPGAPYHLTVLVDSSAQTDEKETAVRTATHAAIAEFTTRFAPELASELPGSKTTLFHLPLAGNTIEPAAAAKLIWSTVLAQEASCKKYKIARNCGGSLRLEIL